MNSSHPLRWKCSVGHEWLAKPRSIRTGHWCPFCAQNRRLRLEEMRQIARERGGQCLSTNYKNGATPLLWACRLGHLWKARAAQVKSGRRRKGSWCRECYNWRRRFHGRHSLLAMRGLAISRGGVCLSPEYLGSKVKLSWECALGHRWQAAPSYVIQGSWCPVCARNQRLTLRQFQEIAATRGGTCLSETYTNERTALWWRCAEGHEWKADPARIKRGSWCVTCAHAARRSVWTRPPAISGKKPRKAMWARKSRRMDSRNRRSRITMKVTS